MPLAAFLMLLSAVIIVGGLTVAIASSLGGPTAFAVLSPVALAAAWLVHRRRQ